MRMFNCEAVCKWAKAKLLLVSMASVLLLSASAAEATYGDERCVYIAGDDTVKVEQPQENNRPGRFFVNLNIVATRDYVMDLMENINKDEIVNTVTDLKLEGSTLLLEQSAPESVALEADLSGLKTEQGNQNSEAIQALQEGFGANEQRFTAMNNRMSKVGARAAALAALHPLDFDPSDKLNFAAGYGNYKGENAAAIGAFYRPNEKVMFSIAGTMSGQENMVNAGVSFSLDRTNGIVGSKAVMAREITELKEKVAKQDEQIAKQDEQIAKQEQQIAELVNLVKQLSSKAN